MLRLPRVAVGTLQADAETQPCTWALMDLLSRGGAQVQHFHSRASFLPLNAALAVTGLNTRYLDSWLMTKDICREAFVHGAGGCDLALVEGRFETPRVAGREPGSRLDLLCDWLDLPRIVVLDVSRLADCELPERPDQVDGVLLDRVKSPSDVFRLQTCLEALWDVPVLGALLERSSLEDALARLPRGSSPPRELCRALGDQLARFARPDRIRALAGRREFPPVRPLLFSPATGGCASRGTARSVHRPLTVAVAFDAAFNCYFPDTLDLLELRGANVVDFSPLRDEVLPEADIVYLGCGHPEFEAEALASNHCMLLALRNHVRGGRRVYAEGGGLAYLCEHLETPKGELAPMLGILPGVARLNRQRTPVRPVEVTMAKDTWLGCAGTPLRGYLNSNWSLEPTGPLGECLAEPGYETDLLEQFQVIASRMHLNFAAQPGVLDRFFLAMSSQPALAASRTSV
jgi:cobyrinic acid a,c-diamide synthase